MATAAWASRRVTAYCLGNLLRNAFTLLQLQQIGSLVCHLASVAQVFLVTLHPIQNPIVMGKFLEQGRVKAEAHQPPRTLSPTGSARVRRFVVSPLELLTLFLGSKWQLSLLWIVTVEGEDRSKLLRVHVGQEIPAVPPRPSAGDPLHPVAFFDRQFGTPGLNARRTTPAPEAMLEIRWATTGWPIGL